MKLESLKPNKGSVKANDRVGRGHGSGGGGTAKRGHKGAKSRSGYSQKRGFEGGQMPLQRRVPKFGFKNINRVEYKAINLDTIQSLFDKTGISDIDLGVLYSNGLISKSDLVKVLGRGELTAMVNLRANAFSASAIAAIEKVGGTANVDATLNRDTATLVEQTVAEVIVTEKPTKIKKKVEGDDLKLIEGVGPKIANLLINAGIVTFADLAATSAEKVSEILSAAGSNFASHNPATWADQASLARDCKWDELKELQDRLNGGRAE
jgi:large subunit ribosomal protein L15